MSLKFKYLLLAGISLAGIIFTLLQNPISQNPHYHCFADDRALFGIPNFWNVASNLPFVLIGLTGIVFLLRKQKETQPDPAGLAFFSGIFLTGFGSVCITCIPTIIP